MYQRIPLDPETSQAWVTIAHQTRMYDKVLGGVADPRPRSRFALIDSGYPYERASTWHRSYLKAALEHLLLWAEFVAPCDDAYDPVVGDSSEWEWFDSQLAHPDGRARGGEPCVICEQPVPANAHWKQRDRHVCSARCNTNLRRRFRRKMRSGAVQPPEPSPPSREAGGVVFRTATAVDAGGFPYEFLGWAPLVGDVVERHGSVTAYLPADPVTIGGETMAAALCVHANTGAEALVAVTPDGRVGGTWFVCTDAAGGRVHVRDGFDAGGVGWCWTWETFRDVADDGSTYSWSAPICANFENNGALWTPEYRQRSEALRRTTASTAAHARRQRMIGTDGQVERIDPHAVYERDRWVCQLCWEPVDPLLRHPDLASASLDHRIPLAAGGLHAEENVQCAHLQCNLRKGARTP